MRSALILVFACAAVAADNSALVDRVGTTGFVQLEAESFQKLPLKEQALAYWLSQASIAIDPINYDQNSIWGLRQKRLLEAIVTHAAPANPQDRGLRQAVLGQSRQPQRNDGAEVSAGVFVRGIEDGGDGGAGRRRFQERGLRHRAHPQPGGAGSRTGGAAAIAVRPRFRADHHRQEPARVARHPASQRQQLLLRRQPGGPEELSRPASAEFAAGEERFGQAGGRDLPRRNSGRQDSGGPLRPVPEEGQRVSGKSASLRRAGAGPGHRRADPLLPDGRSGRLDALRHRLGAEQRAGGFRQRVHRGLPRRARRQGHGAEFRQHHR